MADEVDVDLERLRRHASTTDWCADRMEAVARSAAWTEDSECFGAVMVGVRLAFWTLQASCTAQVEQIAAGLRRVATALDATADDYERVDEVVSVAFAQGRCALEGAR
jgi:hypothetical protein